MVCLKIENDCPKEYFSAGENVLLFISGNSATLLAFVVALIAIGGALGKFTLRKARFCDEKKIDMDFSSHLLLKYQTKQSCISLTRP